MTVITRSQKRAHERAKRRHSVAALDSGSYPHILERIIELASDDALIGLRGTSRSLRTAVDKRLFRHLEIVFPPDKTYAVLVAKGSSLRLDWLWYGGGPDPRRPEEQESVNHMVEAAEVVDLNHDSYAAAHRRIRLRLDDRLETLRPTLRAFPPTQLHTEYDYGFPVYAEQLLNTRHGEKAKGSVVLFGMYARGGWSSRAVFVVEAAPNDISTKRKVEAYVAACPGGMHTNGERVIHLVKRTTPRLIKSKITHCLLKHIIKEHFANSEMKGIVVGGSVQFRRLCGLEDDASHEDFLAAADRIADSDLDEYIDEGWLGETEGIERAELVKRWRQHATFMTPEEYEVKVGPRQFALETRRDPNGPPAKFIQ